MALFSFIIFSFIKTIISTSQNSNINYYKESDKFNSIMNFIEIPDLSNKTEEDWKIFFINIFTIIKDAPDIIRDVLTIIKDDITNNNRSDALSYIVKDLFNNSNPILNDTIDLLKAKSENKSVLDYFIEILSNDTMKNDFIFRKLKCVMNFTEFSKLINRFYQKYKAFFFDVLDLLPKEIKKGRKSIIALILELKDYIKNYQDILFELLCKITSNYRDRNSVINDLKIFFIENCTNTSFFEDLQKIYKNKTFIYNLLNFITFDVKESNKILELVLLNDELLDIAIQNLKNKTIVEELAYVLSNIYNTTYIGKNVSNLIKNLIGDDKKVRKILVNAFQNITRIIVTEIGVKRFLRNGLTYVLQELIKESDGYYNISKSCIGLFNYTYFNPPKNDTFKFFYTKKLLIDTTKSKNDFLTYENCLNNLDKTNYSNNYSFEQYKYQIKPIYVIGKIIDRVSQSKLKNSIYYEKYNYMIGFCFPQGRSNDTNDSLCSNEDYGIIIKIFNSIANNVSNATIKVFNITDDDIKEKSKPFKYFSLIVIISAIPLFIWIFLILYKNIKLSKLQNNEINNELKSNNKNNKISKYNGIQKREFSNRKKAPKWFRLLNEYFNLVKNGNELFNFTLNQTNFNNFNGITYIKGILGISMILNIFGLNFLIVANSLTKKQSSYQFYTSVSGIFYIVDFIALRYCPRIIFSCSGYTLIYKFLNFIEHDSNFCFFKFLILQSYKFFLLILASIYLRFCIYYIDTIFLKIKNPMTESFNEELIQHNGGYFFNLISFLFYNIKDENEIFAKESAFIPYLYLPINEIILFIIGIAMISLGYKFKLRFDIIIIVSFILIYLFKLIIFFAYLHRKEMYSTLYIFLHGYGILMFNPIFNFPSFLVGMYFGLVNFTIQRGINNFNKIDKKNSEYELLEKEQISPINEDRFSLINKVNLYNMSESDMSSRSLSYSQENSSIIKENSIYIKKNNTKLLDEEYEKKKKYLDINMPEETDDILMDMPFLKSTVDFTNFHRKNQDKKLFKIILAIFIFFILFFIFVRYIFIYTNITKELKEFNEKVNTLTNILSLEKIITNNFLNILYVIDIELVVIMINWIFFYLYFKGGQINDFLSHIYWSFFIKSYFSFSLVSSLVILYILYQSESIIKVSIYTIFLYSLISGFFIFIAVVVFYSCYEYPLRKIFKTLKFRRSYINLDDEEFTEDGDEYLN